MIGIGIIWSYSLAWLLFSCLTFPTPLLVSAESTSLMNYLHVNPHLIIYFQGTSNKTIEFLNIYQHSALILFLGVPAIFQNICPGIVSASLFAVTDNTHTHTATTAKPGQKKWDIEVWMLSGYFPTVDSALAHCLGILWVLKKCQQSINVIFLYY